MRVSHWRKDGVVTILTVADVHNSVDVPTRSAADGSSDRRLSPQSSIRALTTAMRIWMLMPMISSTTYSPSSRKVKKNELSMLAVRQRFHFHLHMDSALASCAHPDVEDIEDAISSLSSTPSARSGPRVVLPKRKNAADDEEASSKPAPDSTIPATQTIYVRTWGCSHNNSDGEYMAGYLAAAGYKVTTTDPDSADLHLLNSCTVKTPSEMGLNNAIAAARDAGKFVVIAGCVPQAQSNAKQYADISIVGVNQIDRVAEVVEETLKGHTVRLLSHRRDGKLLGKTCAQPLYTFITQTPSWAESRHAENPQKPSH